MKSSSHLTVLSLLHLFIEGHMSTSCGTFGNDLNSNNTPAPVSSNYYSKDGTYFGIGAPLACAGNATRWNVCYYPTANSTSASATLQVYRCSSGSCNRYAQVPGSAITVTSPSYTSTPPSYVCTNISLTSTFTVNAGDVLVGCIPQNNGLHIAANLSGSSVYYRNRNFDCSSRISLNDYQGQSGLSLLISLDVDECAVNNGGCGQICNDTTSGYNCSCYPGYQLQFESSMCITSNVSTGSASPSNTQEGSAPAIAASITVIVIIAVVVNIATVLSVVLWQRRHARKLIISAARNSTIDNVMYSTTTGSVTIASKKAGITAVYEPLKDEESKYAQAQAVYETPQASGVQNIYNKQPPTHGVATNGDNVYTTVDEQIFVRSRDSQIEDENPYYMPASYEEELYVQLENQRIKKIPRDKISATKMLGSGQFGGVQIGIWSGSKGKCEVAIKTLNPTITQPDAKVKFLQEAAIMAQFRHPNVIQLYGIVTDGEPVMLVIELAHKKDLRTHLVTLKPDPGQLAHQDLYLSLLTYSKQIAAGMKYLSNKSFVHRDLAARNILVTQDCICKIADFGMSRDLADDTYYVSHGGMVPIRWTAPEAIHFKKYSTASDVWSYGCLLYEIWGIGCKPYEGIGNSEIVEKVDSGYRLPPPPGCPLLVYQLMIQCWNPETFSRPSFRDIYLSLYQSTEFVLKVPDEAHLTHPQAGVLGAPLEAGEKMYIELQKTYV